MWFDINTGTHTLPGLQPMKALREIINLQGGFLFENLGNLNQIDPDYINLFKTKDTTAAYNKKGERQTRSVVRLKKGFGQSSPINTHVVKSASKALDALLNNEHVRGIIVRDGPEQLGAIVPDARSTMSWRSRSRGNTEYTLKLNTYRLSELAGMTMEEVNSEITHLSHVKQIRTYKNNEIIATTVTKTGLTGLLRFLYTNYFKKLENPNILTIERDTDQANKQATRIKSREGLVPLPNEPGYRDLTSSLRNDLRSRLDAFKSSKLGEGASTPQELVKMFIEHGYANKVKFGGFTYDLYRDSISLDALLKPDDRWHNKARIDYKINENTAEFKQAKQEYKNKRADHDDWKKSQEWAKEHMPPRSISVNLGLKGGRIEPVSIDEEERDFW